MEIVNWKIVSHPMNWVILFLMVMIAGIGIHFIVRGLGATGPAPMAS